LPKGIVKSWSVCAVLGQIGTENEQKPHLCAFFSWMSRENERTLHNMEAGNDKYKNSERVHDDQPERAKKTCTSGGYPFFY